MRNLTMTESAESQNKIPGGREAGFTLLEIIMAIVIIAIVVPTFGVVFSGLKDSKAPESAVLVTFISLQQFEAIAGKTYADIPASGTYDCATFQATVTEIICDASYTYNWEVQNVAAGALDTPLVPPSTFKKVILTVTGPTGGYSISTTNSTIF